MTADIIDVAIVGGGPAGLTAAIELALLGVDAHVFERRRSVSPLPRAHLLNQRTMEILDGIGVADDVHALSPPDDRWHRVGWYTALAGDRAEQGREIGHIHAWGGGPDRDRYSASSPQKYANVPQMRLDPLLRAHAERQCPGSVHFGATVTALRHVGDLTELDLTDAETSTARTVRARYVIAADGGRTCATALGVDMEGPTKLLDVVSLHVSADLSPWAVDDEVLLYYFIDPQGRGTFRGSLCAMGPDRWGTRSEEWAVHLTFPHGDAAADDTDHLVARVRDMLGIDDLALDVHAVSRWELEGVTARRYRTGNVFLVGNAAHRHPPNGGLGLNTAVQDVHNLVWKLHQVLTGGADDALLDTYESERRPVGLFTVQHSLSNVGGHRRIGTAMGVGADASFEDGWKEIAAWLAPGSDGDRRRRAVADAVASNADDYGQLNVEMGYAYSDGAVIGDGTTPPVTHTSLREYTPTTRPGHHLPHARIGTDRRPVLDSIDRRTLTLLVDTDHSRRWSDAVAAQCLAITVVEIDEGEPEWRRVRQTDPGGAILVRPDGFVAWRTSTMPEHPEHELAQVWRSLSMLDKDSATRKEL